jgi:hypothetical protein
MRSASPKRCDMCIRQHPGSQAEVRLVGTAGPCRRAPVEQAFAARRQQHDDAVLDGFAGEQIALYIGSLTWLKTRTPTGLLGSRMNLPYRAASKHLGAMGE